MDYLPWGNMGSPSVGTMNLSVRIFISFWKILNIRIGKSICWKEDPSFGTIKPYVGSMKSDKIFY